MGDSITTPGNFTNGPTEQPATTYDFQPGGDATNLEGPIPGGEVSAAINGVLDRYKTPTSPTYDIRLLGMNALFLEPLTTDNANLRALYELLLTSRPTNLSLLDSWDMAQTEYPPARKLNKGNIKIDYSDLQSQTRGGRLRAFIGKARSRFLGK
ncbi:hypothetical protein KC660_00180 [Candidatus Dojkabacteria bacterium]|uniref:Uncharacterized protein n=1 Tax=Candidatus Dojkabacteria bacterium TaxID=2099670 RepID=A0A955RHP9_9BACT|nr:hypothetical protein [Candidatus Dojkabacteria bacterium]